MKKEVKKDNKLKEKKDEKKPEKKDEVKDGKTEEEKVDKINSEKKDEVKTEDKNDENKKEEKKDEIKKEEKNDDVKPEEKKEEIKQEEKKEEIKSEEKKEEIKSEEQKEPPTKEEIKEEPPKNEAKAEDKIEPEEPKKNEEPKVTGKPNKILMMKFVSLLNKYIPYLTAEDIYTMGKVNKNFYKPCLEALKKMNEQKLSKEKEELTLINQDTSKLIKEFTLSKLGAKALESLNNQIHTDYFKKEATPGEDILLCYRIYYQLINKEKDILKEKNLDKFWKLIRENLLKNSENGIGNYIQNEFKNLDFSVENIHKLNCLCEGQEERIGPINIGKKDSTTKFICLLVKEPLEYIKIITAKTKKASISEAYQKYLEFIIKKREEDQIKLNNLISKS